MRISVSPSNNIFTELGNNTYDFKDLLSELIDNSIAARIAGSLLTVKVCIEVDEGQRPTKFMISDDATGIPADKLGPAISPAALQTENSLNEHGLGMKQAVAALGKLESLTTKTSDRDQAIQVPEFRFGDMEAPEVDVEWPHGTKITVVDLKSSVVTNAASYTRSIVPYLGARYRRFLRSENRELNLIIKILRAATQEPLYEWDVREVKPTYFHPGTRENRPVFSRHRIESDGWAADLTFGYAPKEESEYEELGVEVPNKFHPYRVALGTQGLDVILHDRIILFHQLSEIGIINQRHPDYNAVRGEIVLLSGFSTAITKNSIIQDTNFRQCISAVKDILTGTKEGPQGRKENYVQHKSYPEEIPETLLRDRLCEWLTNNPLQRRNEVSKEYSIEGIEGFIDILADGEAWELKREQANALDVYQLFMYLDIDNIRKGYLVAKSFTPGAQVAVRCVRDSHQ